VIRGTLREFSLPEIIRLVSQTRRTGVLEIKGPTGSGRVHFRDGAICGAESTLSREPLGRKLVRSGVLSESQLWNALSRQDKSAHRLGETLLAAGLAAPDEVATALREQVEDSIVDVLRLEPTDFSWNAEVPHEGVVMLPAENLLATLSDRMHELELIKSRIPSDDASVSMAPIPPFGADEIRLTLDDWRVLVFLGARRTVRDLLHYSGSGKTHMLRSLERLVSTGLIEVTDPPGSHHSLGESGAPVTKRGRHLAADRPGFQESDVIRLPGGGVASAAVHDVFKIAVVGSSPYGLGPETGAVLAALAGPAPIDVSCWSTSGPPASDEFHHGSQKPYAGPRVRPLRRGRLNDADLVIGLDWSTVAEAIATGSARAEVTFTLLELWALADHGPEGPGFARRARDAVRRAHARRISGARLLSTLEIVETRSGSPAGPPGGDQIERVEEVCGRIADILYGRS
jgi:hypothetical protein